VHTYSWLDGRPSYDAAMTSYAVTEATPPANDGAVEVCLHTVWCRTHSRTGETAPVVSAGPWGQPRPRHGPQTAVNCHVL